MPQKKKGLTSSKGNKKRVKDEPLEHTEGDEAGKKQRRTVRRLSF